jgi:hypothetical protein
LNTLQAMANPRRVAFTLGSRPKLRVRVSWYLLCNDVRGDVASHTQGTVERRAPAATVPPMPQRLGGLCTLYVNARLSGTGRLVIGVYSQS